MIVKKKSAVKTCDEGANKTVVFNSVTCDFVRETRLVLLPEAFPTGRIDGYSTTSIEIYGLMCIVVRKYCAILNFINVYSLRLKYIIVM